MFGESNFKECAAWMHNCAWLSGSNFASFWVLADLNPFLQQPLFCRKPEMTGENSTLPRHGGFTTRLENRSPTLKACKTQALSVGERFSKRVVNPPWRGRGGELSAVRKSEVAAGLRSRDGFCELGRRDGLLPRRATCVLPLHHSSREATGAHQALGQPSADRKPSPPGESDRHPATWSARTAVRSGNQPCNVAVQTDRQKSAGGPLRRHDWPERSASTARDRRSAILSTRVYLWKMVGHLSLPRAAFKWRLQGDSSPQGRNPHGPWTLSSAETTSSHWLGQMFGNDFSPDTRASALREVGSSQTRYRKRCEGEFNFGV